MPRARPGRPTLDRCKGGLTRRGSTQGGWGAGGPRVDPGCPRRPHGSRSPDPLARLDRRAGLRLPPIVMVVMLAQHHQRQTCATGRAISSRRGQCGSSKQSWGALEAGCSAGGGSGSPGCAGRGARWKRGAREPLGLSEPKCLLVVFAPARDTKCPSYSTALVGTRGGSNGPRRAATLGEFSLLVGLECLPLSTVQPPAVNTEAAESRLEDIGSSQTDGGSICAIAVCAPITASSALLPAPSPVTRPCTMRT